MAEEFDGLTGEEILEAKICLIKCVQSSFTDDKNFANKKKQLNLFQDEHGLWRCGGRLGESELPYDAKHPWILHKNHHFTKLAIYQAHKDVKHNGSQETLNKFREQFWITKPRTLFKRLVKECTTCKRHEGKPYGYPEAPPLPKERVYGHYAFENIGIDYAGPVYVKDIYSESDITHKAWIVLTTCTTTRAIYLDLVPDCSGPTCVNVLSPYISTHGAPKIVISDNGKNFICKTSWQIKGHFGNLMLKMPLGQEASLNE